MLQIRDRLAEIEPDLSPEEQKTLLRADRRLLQQTALFYTELTRMGLLRPQMRRAAQLVNDIVWEGTFHNNFADRQQAIDIFHQHNEQVKQRVPPEKLLVYEVKQGWEPAMRFSRSSSPPRQTVPPSQ